MRVLLTVHGGEQALTDVVAGLVQRNVRSIREGKIPLTPSQAPGVMPSAEPVWRDALTAAVDGAASRGTLAAWQAAGAQIQGKPAHVALVGGIPDVVYVDEPQGRVRIAGLGGSVAVGAGVANRYAPDSGRVDESMLLTIDDDLALPVREINTQIAQHNARRMVKMGLPKLYRSGVYYAGEGTPELWWDAEEILRNGHDDCEGLAAYRAGELIALENLDADVYTRFVQAPPSMGGGRIFHAITRVKVPDPTDPRGYRYEYDDPSVNVGKYVPGGGMEVPDWYKKWAAQARAEGREL
jgi:hypothetical protein